MNRSGETRSRWLQSNMRPNSQSKTIFPRSESYCHVVSKRTVADLDEYAQTNPLWGHQRVAVRSGRALRSQRLAVRQADHAFRRISDDRVLQSLFGNALHQTCVISDLRTFAAR